jgi:hypothetical protein
MRLHIADLKINFGEILLGISTNTMKHLFTLYFTLDLFDMSNKIKQLMCKKNIKLYGGI